MNHCHSVIGNGLTVYVRATISVSLICPDTQKRIHIYIYIPPTEKNTKNTSVPTKQPQLWQQRRAGDSRPYKNKPPEQKHTKNQSCIYFCVAPAAYQHPGKGRCQQEDFLRRRSTEACRHPCDHTSFRSPARLHQTSKNHEHTVRTVGNYSGRGAQGTILLGSINDRFLPSHYNLYPHAIECLRSRGVVLKIQERTTCAERYFVMMGETGCVFM